MSCDVDPDPSESPSCSTPSSVSIVQMRSYPIYLARQISSFVQTVSGLPPCLHIVPQTTQTALSTTCLLQAAVVLPLEIPPPLSLMYCEWFYSMYLFSIGTSFCRCTLAVLFVLSICNFPLSSPEYGPPPVGRLLPHLRVLPCVS